MTGLIPISVGKIRGLQQCSTPHGGICVMALDHRNNLRNMLRSDAPDTVSPDQMSDFKRRAISILAPATCAVLLDPEVGGAQCITTGSLPGSTGLVMAVEATGYTGDPTARLSTVLPGWSPAKARRMGASAIKLLVYFHPDASSAPKIESLVKQVAQDCAHEDLPFMLEILSYSPNPAEKKLPPAERRRVVIESARRLTIPGVDVLKAEFPVDHQAEPDEQVWAQACAELSAASRVPWILLSASANYDTYLRQVTVACQNGASGIAVGRAVWQEAPALQGESQINFLQQVARLRLSRLTGLVDAIARPWTEFFAMPDIDEKWYKQY